MRSFQQDVEKRKNTMILSQSFLSMIYYKGDKN